MPGLPLTGAPDTTVPSFLIDERELERQFRAHFSRMVEEAKSFLGDAAPAAPRVVETVFRQAWQDRQQITDESELTSYRHESLHRCAARELSRRAAAHHLGGSNAAAAHRGDEAPDVDQSWARLHRLLHPEDGAQGAQVYAEKLRHEAATHVGDFVKPRSWRIPLLIGVVTAAIILVVMWRLNRLGAESAVARALSSSDARSLAAGSGQMGIVTLDDSTKVTLAAGSKVIVPRGFGPKMRAVKLEGAATFQVAKGQVEPFQVHARNAVIVVTGTTLTVRSFPTDATVVVQVREGNASMKAGKETREMTAGSAWLVEKDGRVREPSATELAEAVSWTDRKAVIVNRPLREALAEINRWYGVEIRVPELKLLDNRVTVESSLDSLRAAIAQVENTGNVEFGYEEKTMVFRTKKAQAKARR
jgi:transmembrane sensor